ncbi:histo-blood group ABO system transferase 1 [Microcaecilia unicolor]|uniref:Histo-blood group ABO system transferase 1-like n=3 Tax=Microcaecilia unicolor TaxID=1415580 RepID=A0A6P7XRS2_9AMPH|nr:histo-blood group ABO system transferase 1-like [Microcaecilia unicolor]XP_030053370.1 histo-blood group ABO system transferase 1-like [Microcaecilia unicolor]
MSKPFVSLIIFIMGTMIGFLMSKWLEVGSLRGRYPEEVPGQDLLRGLKLHWMPANGSLPIRTHYSKPDIGQVPRNEVMILTPWLAPIVWEGTFNSDILKEDYQQKNYRIGLTVSAIGKYIKLLKKFLESAERYFMKEGMVNYYVFTDRPDEVKALNLEISRTLRIITVPEYSNWEQAVLGRMEVLKNQTELLFQKEVDYLVSLDTDIVMLNPIGVEILGDLVSVIHPALYHSQRKNLPYERRPASRAFIPEDEGDFYYQVNFFLGTVQRIYHLTKTCYEGIQIDKANGIQARVFEESHFNKYLVYNKPTKVLSPEYIWSNSLGSPKDIKIKRVNHGDKHF